MKKTLLLLFALVTSLNLLFSQVSIIESYDAGTPAGWTDSYGNTTSQVCAGNSERDNLYSGSATGNMTSPNQVAASNGTDITFSIDYKVVDWSAATDPTADGWGSADLQYSTDDGATWTTVATLDDSNDSNSNVCSTFGATILGSAVPAGSDLKFQVSNTWGAGDYYFYIDNFIATQVASNPPNCDATLSSPLVDFPIDGNISWTGATGAPTGYKVSIGTSSGGTDIANNVDVMTNASYTPIGLAYGTTYYTTITPYNASGDATGCTEESFVTAANPNSTATVTCGSTTNDTHCYDNNDVSTWLYTASDGASSLQLTFNAGGTENSWDEIIIYDGVDASAPELYNGYGAAGDLTGLTVTSTGPNLFFAPTPDGSASCQSGGSCCAVEWDWSVACLSCTIPTVSIPADAIDNTNCPATVDVSISIDDIGDPGTLTISGMDDTGAQAGTGGTVTAAGIFTITNIPVPQTSWTITVSHQTDSSCDVVLGPFLLNCPPVNDAACDAQALVVNDPEVAGTNAYSTFETDEPTGSCWASTTTGNSVWYSFVAPASGLVEITTDFATGLTDSQLALYEVTDCADLTSATEIDCSEDDGVTGSGWMSVIETSASPLTGGSTYYVQVDGYSSAIGDFDIQVKELPPANNDCNDAAVLAEDNAEGAVMLEDQSLSGASFSGSATPTCFGGTVTSDVWFTIETDADGGMLEVSLPVTSPGSDLGFAVYMGTCGSFTEMACSPDGTAASFMDPVAIQEKGAASSRANETYYVQVFNKSATDLGPTFTVSTGGAALLPVELSSFEAESEARGNKIMWSTASEINADFIEVLASPNGSTKWQSVGQVASKGNSTSRVSYDLMDMNPYAVTYYRLKATDKDGSSELSHIINVRRQDKVGKMALSPNPTSRDIMLQTVVSAEQNAQINIVSLSGQLMKNLTVNLQNGLNTINVDLDDLASGIYLFRRSTKEYRRGYLLWIVSFFMVVCCFDKFATKPDVILNLGPF